ncbi:Rho GTPase-activating protein [Halotydeus destructor]|nr:Rho GTPase-activating protein [Halotydeus destructor]
MPKPRRRRNPRKTKLDIVSQNLLGSAELSSARGNVEDAIKMCLEVIKENPKAHEPYQTLAHFYDDLEDFEKAFQYHMIAAYLCPRDLEGWMQVAELALERKDLKNAILCYSKAIRINPEDFSLRLERSKLYEEVKDIKKAICGYEDVIGMLKEADGEDGLKLATRVARMHFENNSCVASIQIIEKSFQKFEQFIVSENVNMYIELLISEKLYVKAMQAFTKYCGVEFLMSSSPFDETLLEEKLLGNSDAIEVVLQFDVPIDLKSKLVVCLIHLRCFKSVKQLQQAIEQEDAEEMGDLYLDIAEAYMDIASYPEAEPFLRKLVNTQNYNLPAVWLRHARCLKEMQELEQSIEAYYKVVHYAANHFDARLELSDLLLSLNRSKEATEVSLQSEKDQLNIDLLLVRCRLLYDQKQYAEFAKAGRLLLSSDMIYLTHPKELTAMITSSTYRTRLETLRDVHKDVGLDSLSLKKNYVGNEVEADELFDIYAKVCRVVCFQLKDYKELERIVLSAYTCGSFVDREQELDFFALMSMYISRNKEYVYKLFKAVVGRSPNNNQVWNVFSPIMSRFYQDLRHNRFCLRLFVKHPDLLPLAYFNGHNALMSGSYKHALAEYINIYKQDPNDAFAALCVSLGFLHLACQKFMSDKNSIVCQENIGAHSQRILGEGAGMYATYPQPVQYYQPGGQPATLRRVVQLPMGVGPAPGIHHQHPQHHGQHPNHALHHGQVTYGTLNAARQPARMPEMVLQSDFRKVSGISSEMFRQIEAIEKEYDPQTASLIEAAERRGEMIIRLLDPRNLGRAGVEAGRRYLAMSIDGQTVQFVEIIKSPGQTLGLYIREGDGIRTTEGVFISRIAPESPIYNSGVLKIGDEILAVNLVDVRRMSLDDVVIVMSIPRRLVLTIRSQLFMPGMASNAATLRRQAQYADEYRQPVVIVKKELQDDAYGSEDVNSMRDSENGQLIHARLKGLPTNMPPVAVALEGEESLYEEAAMYYSAQPLRNTLRPMSRARDDTYVQIYQKAVDARLRPMGIVSNQPQTLQRAYPGTLDNLAGHTMNYHDMMSRRPPLPVSRMAMSRPSSALSHRPASAMGRQRFWDDLNSGPARRSHQRTLSGGDHGLPPTVSDDFLERYSRPLSRSSVRTPSGGYPSVVDMRNKRYDDLRSSMSSQALAALRRRAAADGSVSDTEASTRPTYGLKHHIPESKYTSRLSGRSSAMDSLRSNSLPRPHRSGLSDYRSKQHSGHLRRSSSRNQTQPIRLDRSLYDEDSDGANSAPEMPDKPRRHLGPRNVMPSSHHDYSSEDYRQWLTRAPSTSAIYDTVRRLGRPSSTLPPGIASSNSLSKIAHSAESLLDTLRLEHQKNLLADLYANRAAIVAAGRSLSPTSSVTLNQRHTNAVSPDSLALKMARHGRPQLMPHQPSAMDYLKGTIPHPTPVKPCEDGRMNLLTLNPREFFKYRYEKPTGGQPQGIGRQMSTSDSLVTIPDQANIPGLPQPSLDSVHQHRDHMGFSGIIWIHLLAGRGLRASSSTGGPSAVPVTSTATSTAASSNGQQSVASVGEGPGVNRDLYCVIECDRVHRARTVVRSGESSFDWDEIFELDLVDCKEVSFLLYSWDPQYRHKLCYKGIINLVSLSLDSTPVHSLALKMEPRGTLYIKMRYKEPNSTFQRTPSATPLPTTLFGVDVESVVNRERSGSNVPLLIKRSIEEIEKRGLELVGIYRLCGSAVRKKMLREAFEKNVWLVDLTAEHVPDINVITRFFEIDLW